MEVEKANGWEWRMKVDEGGMEVDEGGMEVDEGDMEVVVMNEGLKKKF